MLQPLSSGQVGAARRPVPVRVLVVLAALVLAAATTACAGPPPVRPPASATPQLHLDGPLAGHDDTAAGAQSFPGPRPGAWELVGTLPHSPTSARVWDWAPGPASAAQVGPRSATSVADDLHALTNEIIARLVAAEPKEEGA